MVVDGPPGAVGVDEALDADGQAGDGRPPDEAGGPGGVGQGDGPAPAAGEAWLYEKKNYEGRVWKVKGSAANLQVQQGMPEYIGYGG